MFGGRSLDPETDTLVEIASTCRSFQCLPRSGSLFEQDSYLILGMPIVFKWLNKYDEQETEKNASKKGSR